MAVSKNSVFQHTFVQAFYTSWFIVLAAQIRVPFYPVPMTLQSFAIMLVALLATRRVSVSAVLLYLAYETIGMPVFGQGAVVLSVLKDPCARVPRRFYFNGRSHLISDTTPPK